MYYHSHRQYCKNNKFLFIPDNVTLCQIMLQYQFKNITLNNHANLISYSFALFYNIFRCPSYLFRCDYGGCIEMNKKCNGIRDCRDNSDEKRCLTKRKITINKCG